MCFCSNVACCAKLYTVFNLLIFLLLIHTSACTVVIKNEKFINPVNHFLLCHFIVAENKVCVLYL